MAIVDKIISCIEECNRQNITINPHTVYNGFDIGKRIPIVRWQIKEGITKATPEQIEKLKQLGVFDVKENRTLDENIDVVIQFRKDYPDMPIKSYLVEEDIKKYSSSPEEAEEFKRRHKEAKLSYDYIKRRSNAGKVSKTQMDRCKENYVSTFFGYPSAMEKAADKYGLSIEKIVYIATKYLKTNEERTNFDSIEKAMDCFLQDYLMGNLSEKEMKMFKGNLLNVLEVEQDDETYRRFIKSIAENIGDKNNKFYFYSVKGLKRIFKYLPQRPKEVVPLLRDDFIENNRKAVTDSRKEKLKVSSQRTHQLIDYVKRRTIKNLAVTIPMAVDFSQKIEDEKENEMVKKLRDALVAQRAILMPDEDKEIKFKRNFKSLGNAIRPLYEKTNQDRIRKEGTLSQRIRSNLITEQELREFDIKHLNLVGILETRLKRAGIRTIGQIIDLTPEDIEKIPLTKRYIFCIRSSFNVLGIARTSKNISEEIKEKDLDALKIYTRGNNSLRKNGMVSLKDLTNLTIDEFTEKIGPDKLYISLIDEMNRLGLRFKDEKEPMIYVGCYNNKTKNKKEKDRD